MDNKSLSFKTCRFCLRETALGICIFQTNFVQDIELLTSLEFKGNNTSPNIACVSCVHDIRSALSVRERVINAEKRLLGHDNISHTQTHNETTDLIFHSNLEAIRKYNSEFMKRFQSVVTLPLQNISSNTSIKLRSRINDVPNHFNKPKQQPQCVSMLSRKTTQYRNRQRVGTEFKCEQCNITFPSKYAYYLHSGKHKFKTCPICNKTLRADNLKKHIQVHSESAAVCEICGAVAKNSESLRSHIFLFHKHSSKRFVCEDCGQGFRQNAKLVLHRKKKHGGERTLKCTQCGKAFFQKMFLLNHIRSTHEKQRPHVCEYCGKAFSSKYALRTHVRVHTSEAPYICYICHDGFRQKVSLKTHLKSRHGIEEELKFFCEVCGKGHGSQLALEVHSRLHRSVKCSQCSETFADDDYLQTHVKNAHEKLNSAEVTKETKEVEL